MCVWAHRPNHILFASGPRLFLRSRQGGRMEQGLISLSEAAAFMGWQYHKAWNCALSGRWGEVTRRDSRLFVAKAAVEAFAKKQGAKVVSV